MMTQESIYLIFYMLPLLSSKYSKSQHEITDALLWLNYSLRAQLALPKIDERQGASYTFVIR